MNYFALPGTFDKVELREHLEKSNEGGSDIQERYKGTLQEVLQNKSDYIHEAIKLYFGFTKADLQQKSRKRELCFARHISIYLHAKQHVFTLVKIGQMYGWRDHTTAIHSRDLIKDFIESENSEEGVIIRRFLRRYGFK